MDVLISDASNQLSSSVIGQYCSYTNPNSRLGDDRRVFVRPLRPSLEALNASSMVALSRKARASKIHRFY